MVKVTFQYWISDLYLEYEMKLHECLYALFYNIVFPIYVFLLIYSQSHRDLPFYFKYWKFKLKGYRNIRIYSLSNSSFVCIKETSQEDVSFTHKKHVFYR